MSERRLLELTRAGNPILRESMPKVSAGQVASDEIQQLIKDIRYTNAQKQYGVGLAAPQVGARYALSVIGIKPTPTRPNLEAFNQVIINPRYEGIGRRAAMWEGCQSVGSGNDLLYGRALRFRQIRADWIDENGKPHSERLDGFRAHVFQHETDHLNGILFVDKVRDTTSFMMADEYRKRVANKTGVRDV